MEFNIMAKGEALEIVPMEGEVGKNAMFAHIDAGWKIIGQMKADDHYTPEMLRDGIANIYISKIKEARALIDGIHDITQRSEDSPTLKMIGNITANAY